MKRLSLDMLATTTALEHPLYHESGQVLFKAGEALHSEHLQALRKLEIEAVFEIEADDRLGEFIQNARFERLAPDELLSIHRIAQPVYTADGQLLIGKGQSPTPQLKKTLLNQGVREVFVHRTGVRQDVADLFLKKKVEIEQTQKRRALAKLALVQAKTVLAGKAPDVKEVAAAAAGGQSLEEKPEGEGLDRLVDFSQKVRGKEVLSRYVQKYGEACRLTRSLFESLLAGEITEGEKAVAIAKQAIFLMIDDKDLFLNLLHLESEHDHQIDHAVKTTFLAANIATAMKYNDNQVLEVCVGALLADVGMFTVPEPIRKKPEALTDAERRQVQEHTAAGLNLLKKLTNFPRSTLFTVFQHHERGDEKGYPKGFAKDNIHVFARLVAIADSYTAMTSDRPWRKRLLPYAALETVIRDASNRRFDPEIVKATLRFTSLFPVGSWVELSTGVVGKIVAASPSNYARPTVQPLYEAKTRKPLESMMAVELAKQPRVRVLTAVDGTDLDQDLMRGF